MEGIKDINNRTSNRNGLIIMVVLVLLGVSLASGVLLSLGSGSSPTLEITEVNTSETLVEGGSNNLEVTVENTGSKEGVSNLSVQVGELSEEVSNVSVESNSSTVVSIDSVADRLSAGDYKVNATLGDNLSRLTTDINIFEPATFEISDFNVDKTEVKPNGDFNLSYKLRNTGEVVGDFDASLHIIEDVRDSFGTDSRYFDESMVATQENKVLDVNRANISPEETVNVSINNVLSSSGFEIEDGRSYQVELVSESESRTASLEVASSPETEFTSVEFGSQTEDNRLLTSVNYSLSVTVENTGDVASRFNISAHVNNNTSQTVETRSLENSESQEIVFDNLFSELSAGEYELELSSDSGQNTTRNFEVVEPGNLQFDNINLDGENVTVGSDKDLSLSVSNNGDLQETFNVRVELRNTTLERSVALEAKENKQVVFEDFTSNLSLGTYNVSVSTNDTDTQVSFSVVENAKLSSDNLTLDDEDNLVTTEERVDATFDLQNTGDVRDTFQVFLQLIDGEETSEVLSSQVSLEGNESKQVEFTNVTEGLSSGEYSVELVTRDGKLVSSVSVVEPKVVNGTVNLENGSVEDSRLSLYRDGDLIEVTSTNQSGYYEFRVSKLEDLRVLAEVEDQDLQGDRVFFGSNQKTVEDTTVDFDFSSDTNLSHVVESTINNRSVVVSYSEEFIVSNVYQLQSIREKLDGEFELVRDIDATATESWGGFELIGSQDGPFTGSLVGQDNETYVISGLSVRDTESQRLSVFSAVDNATVRNIVVELD